VVGKRDTEGSSKNLHQLPTCLYYQEYRITIAYHHSQLQSKYLTTSLRMNFTTYCTSKKNQSIKTSHIIYKTPYSNIAVSPILSYRSDLQFFLYFKEYFQDLTSSTPNPSDAYYVKKPNFNIRKKPEDIQTALYCFELHNRDNEPDTGFTTSTLENIIINDSPIKQILKLIAICIYC